MARDLMLLAVYTPCIGPLEGKPSLLVFWKDRGRHGRITLGTWALHVPRRSLSDIDGTCDTPLSGWQHVLDTCEVVWYWEEGPGALTQAANRLGVVL